MVVDGVTAIRDISVSAQDRWYTIDGLRLDGQPLRKGLYIRSGRKVVVQ